MTNLMRKIADAMAKVDPQQVLAGLAESKPQPDETVVGTASDELLRLWGVVKQIGAEYEAFLRRILHVIADIDPKQMNAVALEERVRPLMSEDAEIQNRLKTTKQLFWGEVKADFPATLTTDVAIRRGGQIVTIEEHTHGAIIDVTGLMKMLGHTHR
ncbi:MAG: hypothetical protein HYT39_02505 [Candidatus Sungbacteria bacterium]|nr:hypothetical protein [Candidatus Sungbacteria bacterium]